MSLMNAQAPNFEEAAEFIYSGLYNHSWRIWDTSFGKLSIPSLSFSLSESQEIKHRETTTQGAP